MSKTQLAFHIIAFNTFSEVSGFEFDDLDSLNLLQLRAHSATMDMDEQDCTLVQGDAISDSYAIAYEAMTDAESRDPERWIEEGGAGTPVTSLEECIERVKQMNDLSVKRGQKPVCTGLSLPTGGRGQCYCQRGISATDENPLWQSCKFGGFTDADLFPGKDKKASAALGCSLTKGNGNGGRETRIWPVAKSTEECVQMAKEQCPEANGVTMDLRTPEMFARFGTGCWCEFGQTGRDGANNYQNCELGVVPEEVVIDGAGFDGSCDWYPGTTNGQEEVTQNKATSPEHCAQMVRQQCPDANGATLRISGSGDCFCHRGATNSRAPGGNGVGGERTTWQHCRLDMLPETTTTTTTTPQQGAGGGDAGAAVGDPHLTAATDSHYDLCCHAGVCQPCEA